MLHRKVVLLMQVLMLEPQKERLVLLMLPQRAAQKPEPQKVKLVL